MLGFSLAIEATRSRSLTVNDRERLLRRLLMNCWSSALSVFGAGAAPADRLRVRPLGFNALRMSLADFCSAAWIDPMPASRVTITAARPTLRLLRSPNITSLLCVGAGHWVRRRNAFGPPLVSPAAMPVHAR